MKAMIIKNRSKLEMKPLLLNLKKKRGNFYIHTLGCKVNQAESEKIASILIAYGYEFERKPCDVLFLNTCAVTSEAESKSRKVLHRLIRELQPEYVYIIGCASELVIESFAGLRKENIFFVSPSLKSDFIRNLEDALRVESSFYTGRRTRAFLKIQDGCNRKCAYCIVPLLRGKENSVSFKEVLKEAEKLENEGVKEIVLTGVHLGRYAFDDCDLSLLLKMLGQRFNFRIRLSSIDVEDVTDRLIRTAYELGERFCPHFHIPVQSGSDRILKAMRRTYTGSYFLKRIELIRKVFDNVALSTDVMVGFPGEDESDFQKTVYLINEAKFMRLHVFHFSKRPGTEAEKMTEIIPFSIVKKREKHLLNLSKKIEDDFKRELDGRRLNVLIEKTTGTSSLGRSEYYIDVVCPLSLSRGTIVKLKAKYNNGTIVGEVESCSQKSVSSAKS